MRNQFQGGINGKGYYIALILCAAAIGISGYLYYRNENKDPSGQQPAGTVQATAPGEMDVPAVATRPGGIKATWPTEPGKKPLKTASPVEGDTVAAYAMDSLSYNETTRDWRVHNGVDIAAEAGTQVCAAADGTVYTVYTDDTMGTTVVIRHEGGYVTQYSSLAAEVTVAPGDTVSLGDAIGCVGDTALLESAIGPHVHFTVTLDEELLDPGDFLNRK